ncbi:lysozyme [Dictyobacter sp. S3.2.2.5]|uniref:Lysozyme n=1 Tax=Dictyobacter halimunensis TaxID=3026934 RepID=A0ABQ6G744_9CHLR|nr:lysozyme [Dictyobacter sp. S3.2.2.5]
MRWQAWKKRLWLPGVLALLCLLTLALLLYTGTIWPNTLFVSDYGVRGIDVSSYQGRIDWESVARSGQCSFVFIKATEGRSYKDAYFQANWRGTREQGLLRGAYHFYTDYRTGGEQANNFISMVPKEAGMLPPVLDLEVSGADHSSMLRELKTFLGRLRQYYGIRPIIYTDRSRYAEYIEGNFDDYTIWIRDVYTPVQWSSVQRWTFWQYNSRGHVTGIPGYVDLNVFSGKRQQLDDIAIE